MNKCGTVRLDTRSKVALTIYRGIYGLISLLAFVLFFWIKPFSKRLSEGFYDYLGFLSKPERKANQPLYWVHGVSMGESLVAFAFIKRLKEKYPNAIIAFTTTHPDVYKTASSKNLAHVVSYFPLDFFIFMRRAFDRWQPTSVFVVETDFWPEFSWQCKLRGVPLYLINGRISYKIEGFYTKFKSIAKLVFGSYAGFFVQTAVDKANLESMGVSENYIKLLGNLKADLLPSSTKVSAEILNWAQDEKVLVFGSLHPLEFNMLKKLFKSRSEKIIIAPRNIRLAQSWAEQLAGMGLKVTLRSKLVDTAGASSRILILDSMGELFSLYSMGVLGFVGGTLDPRVGGHNPLEVIHHGVPLAVGPYFRNFGDILDELVEVDAIWVVQGAAELDGAISEVLELECRGGIEPVVKRAKGVLQRHKGALVKTMDLLKF